MSGLQRAYAHLTDPDAAVSLPERRKGAFLGLGSETEAEWRERASEDVSDAVRSVRAVRLRENRAHAVEVFTLKQQIHGTPKMQKELSSLQYDNSRLHRELKATETRAELIAKENRRLRAVQEGMVAGVAPLPEKTVWMKKPSWRASRRQPRRRWTSSMPRPRSPPPRPRLQPGPERRRSPRQWSKLSNRRRRGNRSSRSGSGTNPSSSIASSRRTMPGMMVTEPVLSIRTELPGGADERANRPLKHQNQKQNGRSPSCSS